MNDRMDEYRKSLASVQLPEEQRKRLFHAAVQQFSHTPIKNKKYRCPVRRIVLITALAVALLAATASATGILQTIADVFKPMYGVQSNKNKDVLSLSGGRIGASVTDHDVTVTAEAVIGDKHNAHILFSIEGDSLREIEQEYVHQYDDDPASLFFEQARLTGALSFSADLMNIGTEQESMYICKEWVDFSNDSLNSDDGKMQFVIPVRNNSEIKQGKTTIELKNLVLEHVSGTRRTVEGNWKFNFTVKYEDQTKQLSSGETFEYNDLTFTIDKAELSPLSGWIEFHVDGTYTQNDMEHLDIPASLMKTDGTEIPFYSVSQVDSVKNGKTYCHCNFEWNEILSFESMEHLTFGKIQYPICEIPDKPEPASSAVSSGVTITAENMASSDTATTIFYSLEGNDSTSLSTIELLCRDFHKGQVRLNVPLASSYGPCVLYDNYIMDNKLFFAVYIDNSGIEPIVPKGKIQSVSHIFEDIVYTDFQQKKTRTLFTGHWELNYDISCSEDRTISFRDANMYSFMAQDKKFAIDDLTISAVSVFLKYHTEGDSSEDIRFFLTKKDGSQIDLTVDSGGFSQSVVIDNITYGQKQFDFSQMMPLEDIQSITIGSTVYDISPD